MLRVRKKVIGNLEKCYSIAPLEYEGERHILVAAEKTAPCLLFDEEGREEATVWTQPGGAMTMVQVPGSNGQFLATHKFYSPNDSKEAKIVIVTPVNGSWEVRTLADLPFVHRFDILERGGIRYLLACTLKSGHEYRDDWSTPGKVYAAVLPDNLDAFDEDHPLPLTVLKEGMLKNHGYYRVMEGGYPTGLVSAEQGVFQFIPPERAGAEWEIRQLTRDPTSDAVLLDLDGDGKRELAAISNFHGDRIRIYKTDEAGWYPVYEYPHAEFSHGIFGGEICGKPVFVIGHRKGARNLLAFTWDNESQTYQAQVLDADCGSANVYHFCRGGKDYLLSANREINEIALYELEEQEGGRCQED